jgi:flagellar FliL protein
MRVVGGNTSGQAVVPISQEYQGKREVLDWYTSIGVIRTKSSDPIPASVSVEPVLGYKHEDKATAAEITQRQIEIKDFLRRYFTERTASDLRPQNEEKLRIEIRNSINDDILTSSKIRDVKFLSLDIVEQ